jgi:Flp pilus assembly secretin CpaC
VAIVATGVMLSASIGAQVAAPAASSSIVKSQHLRLPFTRDIQRIAVGDQDIAAVEIVTNRELLVLGRETGRTTLIVWFTDGSLAERTITVQRDLSILQTALQRVHPSIAVESAPDRDAIVLTGRVPDLTVSQLAESIARSYLDAGNGRGNAARPLLAAPPQPAVAPPDAAAAPQAPGAAQAPTPATGQAQPAARLQSEVPPSGTIINLIQLDRIPLLPEEKIKDAIRPLGGDRVTVRRVLRGNVRNDELDTLVLEGEVPNQIALVRILQVAAQLFAARTVGEDEVQVLADEGGGLASRGLDTQAQQSGNFGARGSNNVFGGGSGGGQGARLTNQVRRNVARATAISVADGRILSFIVVKDLPQIRVNIRVYEVNREKLRSYTPVTAAVASTEQLPSTDTSPAANAAQGQAASYPSGSAVQNVLGFLAGGFLNQFQFTSDHAGTGTDRARRHRADPVVAVADRALGRDRPLPGGRRGADSGGLHPGRRRRDWRRAWPLQLRGLRVVRRPARDQASCRRGRHHHTRCAAAGRHSGRGVDGEPARDDRHRTDDNGLLDTSSADELQAAGRPDAPHRRPDDAERDAEHGKDSRAR